MEMHERMSKAEQNLKAVNRRLDENEKTIQDDHDKLIRCEQEHVAFKASIANIEKLTEGIHDMISELKEMRKDLNNVDKRVEEIEGKPAKRWEALVSAFISALVGIVLGYVLKGGF